MWENILNLALNHGLIAGLFVCCLIYILKDHSRREKNYVDIIEKLAEKFKVLEEIQRDIKDLKVEMKESKRSK